MNRTGSVYRFCVTLAMLCVSAAGQSTSQLTGLVLDPDQAVIPGARLTLRHTGSGVSLEGQTNDQGYYVFAVVPPGVYELTAQRDGFQKLIRNGVVVDTGTSQRLDLQLKVGGVTEIVTVQSQAPVLQADNATVGQLIENKAIIDMPLASRRAAGLVKLMGNLVFIQESAGADALPFFALAGGRARNQMWTIDGGVAQNFGTEIAQLGLNPPVETLQEMKVESNNYAAEYGRSSGGFITMSTKAGTNAFHGALYEYLRNNALDARNFFALAKAPRRYNVFGGTIGGPVIKDKTHFFAAYEAALRRDGVTRVLTVPLPQEVQGNFSGRLGALLDPTTRQPFPGNLIPQSRLDPVGRALAAFYPAPNRAGSANNFVANTVDKIALHARMARIDHQFSANDRVFFRYLGTPGSNEGGTVFPNPATDSFARISSSFHQLYTGNWTKVISAAWVNDLRYTFIRRPVKSISIGTGTPVVEQIGLKGIPKDGMPRINVGGLVALGGTVQLREAAPSALKSHEIINNVSWFRGSHAVKFGINIRPTDQPERFHNFKYGSFTYNDVATGAGFQLAALLLGWTQSVDVNSTDDLNPHVDYYGAFLQDDWKVTRRLTLNFGVRWEMDTPRRDGNNKQNGFDEFALNPVSNTPGAMIFSGENGVSQYAHQFDKNNFGPRFGFAWRTLGERTVIRGGYGLTYSGLYNSAVSSVATSGFADSRQFTSPDNGLTPAILLASGVPDMAREPLSPGFGAVTVGQNPRLAPQFFRQDHVTPYAHMLNFGIQRELGASLVADVTWQANLSHKLGGPSVNINETRPELRGSAANQSLRPFPQYGNVLWLLPSWGNSSYHSLNARLEKRYSAGLYLLANFTWSKFIDDVEAFNELGGAGYQSYFGHRLDKALAGNDIAHRLIASSVYELPLGEGKRIGINNTTINAVVGGWSLGGIIELRSGAPYAITEQTNRLNSFSATQRPNQLINPDLPSDRPRAELIRQWFRTDAFTFPGNGVLGNASRSPGRGPGFANVEFSLLKTWRFRERFGLQIRGEFFNLLNRPNFAMPNGQRGNPAFGQISNTVNDARVVQLGLKLTY